MPCSCWLSFANRVSQLSERNMIAFETLLAFTNIKCPVILESWCSIFLLLQYLPTNLCFQYFYSIKDISIGGRCMCNGHADTCDPAGPNADSNILVCRCQHHTCGPQCAQCCRGFEQKKWRISQTWDRFACERECCIISRWWPCLWQNERAPDVLYWLGISELASNSRVTPTCYML